MIQFWNMSKYISLVLILVLSVLGFEALLSIVALCVALLFSLMFLSYYSQAAKRKFQQANVGNITRQVRNDSKPEKRQEKLFILPGRDLIGLIVTTCLCFVVAILANQHARDVPLLGNLKGLYKYGFQFDMLIVALNLLLLWIFSVTPRIPGRTDDMRRYVFILWRKHKMPTEWSMIVASVIVMVFLITSGSDYRSAVDIYNYWVSYALVPLWIYLFLFFLKRSLIGRYWRYHHVMVTGVCISLLCLLGTVLIPIQIIYPYLLLASAVMGLLWAHNIRYRNARL